MKRHAYEPASESTVEPPIAYHYVLVLLVEGLILSGLAWLAAHYR